MAAGPDPGILMPAALALLGAVLLAGSALGGARTTAKRRRGRLDRLRRLAPPGPEPDAPSVLRDMRFSAVPTLDRLIRRYLPRPEILRRRLERAGLAVSLGHYLLLCALIGATAFLLLRLAAGQPNATALLAALGLGLGLPHLYTGLGILRRRRKFIADFPEAIDLMVRGIKSGLPITESIRTVGLELPDPVGEAFRRLTEELRFGRTLDEALWETGRRLGMKEFNFFIVSLAIQSETGGNLSETLSNLATVLRRRKQLKLKIKALSSEAKASAYIIGSLPFVMTGIIFSMNPEYLLGLFADPRGHMMIAGGLVMFAVGAAIMAKMTRFEL